MDVAEDASSLRFLSSAFTPRCVLQEEQPMAKWSDLPIDVLEHLTRFLPLPDYHRFSAVCQNWWIAAKQKRHSPLKQLPWLLVQRASESHHREVFSISENRHYNIDFPELQGQYVCGSSYGWLVTVDIDLNLKLLNPLMGKHYDLPPLLPLRDLIKTCVGETMRYPRGMTYERAQIYFVHKAILDHDPAQTSDFTVMILNVFIKSCISFWRPGNLVWTLVEDDFRLFGDIAYFKGKFYTCDNYIDIVDDNDTNVTYVVDVGPDPKVTRVAPEVPAYDNYSNVRIHLVDFQGELLMLQVWMPEVVKGRHCTKAILVYKLDLEDGKYYPRHHLNGYSLFLGKSSPVVIDPRQFPGCKENCIYYCEKKDNRIYDMLNGTVSPIYPSEIFNPEIMHFIWWTPKPW